jgi:hypothetical protein
MRGLFEGVGVMTIVMNVLHRYVAPFLMGVCMAATTVMPDMASMVTSLTAAGVYGFFSLPAGGRMMMRLTDAVALAPAAGY